MRCVPALSRLCPAVLALLAGCQPQLNWREVRTESGHRALLPCKPDAGERQLSTPLGPMRLAMLGCEAGGRTFAIAEARWPQPAQAAAVLALWRDGATPALRMLRPPQPATVAGADEAWQVTTTGTDARGRAVRSDALLLRRDGRIWQLQVLATANAGGTDDAAAADARATFFGGLRL